MAFRVEIFVSLGMQLYQHE